MIRHEINFPINTTLFTPSNNVFTIWEMRNVNILFFITTIKKKDRKNYGLKKVTPSASACKMGIASAKGELQTLKALALVMLFWIPSLTHYLLFI